MSALRRATGEHHGAIEAVIGLDGDWHLPHYVRVLWGFDHFLCAWEPDLAAALPARLRDWCASRSRLGFLRADLDALGRRPSALPSVAAMLPALPDAAAAIGSLYVIEGSALGGQVIARRLLERHGRTAAQGGAYFTGWGRRTGAMWHEFRMLLAQELDDDPRAIESACRAARGTFEALTRTFETMLNERVTS